MKKDYLLYTYADDTYDNNSTILGIKEFLRDFQKIKGCSCSYKTAKNPETGWMAVNLTIDLDATKEVRRKGAGRKKKETIYTVGEVYEYLKSHTQKEAAERMGISLRTFQRRKKYAEEMGGWYPECDDPFTQ